MFAVFFAICSQSSCNVFCYLKCNVFAISSPSQNCTSYQTSLSVGHTISLWPRDGWAQEVKKTNIDIVSDRANGLKVGCVGAILQGVLSTENHRATMRAQITPGWLWHRMQTCGMKWKRTSWAETEFTHWTASCMAFLYTVYICPSLSRNHSRMRCGMHHFNILE